MTATTGSRVDDAIDRWVYTLGDPVERIRQDLAVGRVLIEVIDERARQETIGRAKLTQGIDWRSAADPAMQDGTRYLVLGEEVGEVARAVLERGYGDPDTSAGWERRLREELVQVAAVAVAWVEAIDARRRP